MLLSCCLAGLALLCLVHPGSVSASSHGPWTCKHSHSPALAVWMGLGFLSPRLEADLLQDIHPKLCSVPQPGWTQHLASSLWGRNSEFSTCICVASIFCASIAVLMFLADASGSTLWSWNNVRSVLLRVFHSLDGRNATGRPDLAVFQPHKWFLEAKKDPWRRNSNTNTKIFGFPVWSFLLFCYSCTHRYPCKNKMKERTTPLTKQICLKCILQSTAYGFIKYFHIRYTAERWDKIKYLYLKQNLCIICHKIHADWVLNTGSHRQNATPCVFIHRTAMGHLHVCVLNCSRKHGKSRLK